MKTRSAEQRFWQKVDVRGEEECWEWRGARSGNRYGNFTIGQRQMGAHRYAWELANGPVPDGLFVLHACDNPPCVNPKHLFTGTQLHNRTDCKTKGRTAAGDHSPRRLHPGSYRPALGEQNHSKLREGQVLEIRRRYAAGGVSQSQLAREYGVNQAVICRIIARKMWKHIE